MKQFWIFQESSRNTGKPLPGLDRLALWELRRLKAKSIKRAWCSSIALWEKHQHLAVNFLRSNAAFSSVRHLNPVFWAHWNPWESQPAWMTWYEVSAYCLEQCSHVETLDDVGFNNLKLHMVRQRKYVLWLGDLWDGDLFQSIKGTYFPQWRWISSWNAKGLTCGLQQPMLWWKRALL